MQWHKAVVAAATGLALGACGSIEIPTKKVDYKSSTRLPSLEIPPDLARPSTDDRFTVPDAAPKGSATFSDYNKDRSVRSPASAAQAMVLPNVGDVRVERAGTQRWLVVPGAPDKLWPVVKEFWQETGFVVNVESPEAGVMETDWSENRAKIPKAAFAALSAGRWTAFIRLPSATSSAPVWSTARSRAPPRSMSATVAWKRFISPKAVTSCAGSRVRQIPTSRRRCCGG
jgi:uncharacterized lipoprotein